MIIVSYGGGVNSTTVLVWMVKHNIKPDLILFADTGGEKQATYEYIKYFNRFLVKNDFPEITIVRYTTKDGNELTLYDDCINNNTIPAIAFGWKTCSQKFKLQPQYKYIKKNYPDRFSYKMYVGFDASEAYRVKDNQEKNFENVYPLIMCGYDRGKCIEIITEAGLCIPPKSSCFFCPNMRPNEILQLSEVEKQLIKEMENNATKLVELKGLGRTFKWTDLINSDKKQLKLFEDQFIEMYQQPCECIE